MTVARRAAGTVATSSTGNLTVTYPTNAVGDILLLTVVTPSTVFSNPVGWTLISSVTSVTACKVYVYWSLVTTVQSGTLGVPMTAAGAHQGVVSSYSGASPYPPNANNINTFTFGSSSAFPSVGFAQNGEFAYWATGANGTTTISTPQSSGGTFESWTGSEVADSSATPSMQVLDGPTNGGVSQLSGSYSTSRGFNAISLAIDPLPTVVTLPYTEAFTGTTGANWSTQWTPKTGLVQISANQGQLAGVDTVALSGARVQLSGMPITGDTDVTGTITMQTNAVEQYADILINSDTGGTAGLSTNCYALVLGYNATAGSSTVKLQSSIAGTPTTLATTTKSLTGITTYSFRINRTGTTLQARVWTGTEPGTWDVTTTLSGTLLTGYVELAVTNGTNGVQRPGNFDNVTVSGTSATTVVRRAGTQLTSTGGTSLALPYPTNAIGDIILCWIATDTTAVPSTPSGWTLITSDTTLSTSRMYLFWRTVASVLSGSVTFTITGSGSSEGLMTSYSGASSTVPSAADYATNSSSTSTTTFVSKAGWRPTSSYVGWFVANINNALIASETAINGAWNYSEAENNASTTPSAGLIDGPITSGTTQLSTIVYKTSTYATLAIAIQSAGTGPAAPVANFTATPTSGPSPLSVAFTDTSTNTPTSWSWNFGDTGTSTSQNPTHNYTSTGTYTVSLMATNGIGNNTNTQTNLITVTAPASVPGAPTGVSATPGNSSVVASFTAPASNGGATITSYTVTSIPGSFTGTGATSPITVTGLANGTSYTFTVHATNSAGDGPESSASASVTPTATGTVSFTGSPLTGSSPLTVAFTDTSTSTPTSWNWNFGDGYASTVQNPSHTYANAGTYTVALTGTNASGSATSIRTNYIAVTGGTGTGSYVLSSITYSASTLTSPTTLSLSDDSISSAQTIPFSFKMFGTAYTSVVVSSNGVLEFGSGTSSSVFSNDPGSDTAGTWPVMVGYGSDLVPSGTTQPKYQTLGTTPNRTFVVDYTNIPFYNSNGTTTNKATFQIKLFETTNVIEVHVSSWQAGGVPIYGWLGIYDGTSNETTALSDSTTRSSVAYRFTPPGAGTPAPYAAFLASTITGAPSLAVTFTDISANSPTSWSWNFGDGGTSTLQNPTYTYTTAGIYSVMLTATSTNGTGTFVSPQLIHVVSGLAPVAQFRTILTHAYTGISVQFTDLSLNAPSAWSWSFGDGGTSTLQFPTHAYATAGTYSVSLTATNRFGTNTATRTNLIIVLDQMSGITRRAISTVAASANPGTTVTATWPTNVVGDFAILVVASSGTATAPAGWLNFGSSTTATGASLYMFWMYISVVQSGTVAVTTSSSVSRAAIVTYSGGVPNFPAFSTAANTATASTALVTQSSSQGAFAVLGVAIPASAAATLSAETSSAGVNWVPSEATDTTLASFPTLSIVDGATTNNANGTLLATLSTAALWGAVDMHPKRYGSFSAGNQSQIASWIAVQGYPWTNWHTVAGSNIQTSSALPQMIAPTGASAVARADLYTQLAQYDTAVIAQVTGLVAAVEQYVHIGINAQTDLNTAGYSPNEIYVRLGYNATAASSTVSLWQGSTQIGSSVTKSLTGTTTYGVRLMRIRDTVYARVWATANAEPSSWDFSTALSSFPNPNALGVPSMAVINGAATTSRTFILNAFEARTSVAIDSWPGTTGAIWPQQWTVDGLAAIQSSSGSLTSPAVANAASHALLLDRPLGAVDMTVTVVGAVPGVVQTAIVGTGSPADLNSATEWLSGVNVRLNYAATPASSTVSLFVRDASLATAVTMSLTGNTAYKVRIQTGYALAQVARAKVWASTVAEPTAWTITSSSYPAYAYNTNGAIGYPALAVSSGTTTARQFTFYDLMVAGDPPDSLPILTLPFTSYWNTATSGLWPGNWSKVLGVDGTSASGTAVITTPSTIDSATRYDFDSLPEMGNIDVLTRFNISSYTGSAFVRININGNSGGSYRSPNDCYYIEFRYGTNTIALGEVDGGIDKPWPAASKTLATGTVYGVRIQRLWQVIRARVWDYSGSEPTTWDTTQNISGIPLTGDMSISLSTGSANAASGAFNNVIIANPVAGSLKTYTGAAFGAMPVKVWNGTAWIQKPVRIWNGSSWIITNY